MEIHIGRSAARFTRLARFRSIPAGAQARRAPRRLDATAFPGQMQAMSELRKVCVYCGSSPGSDPAFVAAARQFGKVLATNRIGLVYGGGSTGMMGALARSVHDSGGDITAVIPEFLRQRELLFEHANEIVVTRDMHERKRIMFERADAFVALPGGIGTLEELVEQLTWAQLGHHEKPILIADINGHWRPLIDLFARLDATGFIHSGALLKYHVCERIDDILPTLRTAAARAREQEKAAETAMIERM
jgi:hypothetical protein